MTYIQEEWKDIPGFNGRYQASSLGRIKAVGHPRRINHTFVMKPQPRGAGGYLGVCLHDPNTGKSKSHFIQVLVALTFIGPKLPAAQVNHKNLNKHDNRLDNLEYETPSGNTCHGLLHGARKKSGRGTVLTPDQVREIRELPRSISIRAAERLYNTSRETIRQIRKGERWVWLD